jgi:hypothetical protein
MKRKPRAGAAIESLLAGVTAARPIEALVLDQRGLARILDWHCQDLHEQRRRVVGTPAEADTVREAKYWAEVLSWIKCQYATELIVTRRHQR